LQEQHEKNVKSRSQTTKKISSEIDSLLRCNANVRSHHIEICDICKLVYSKLRSYLERGSLPSDIQKNIDEDDQYSDYTGNNTENDRRLIIKASLDIVMKRLKYLDSHNPSIYERGLICYDEPVSPFKYDIYFDGNELKDDFVNLVIIIVESSEKPLDLNRGFKRPFECENAHYTYDYQDDYNQMISER
jgi:hypothetical protein